MSPLHLNVNGRMTHCVMLNYRTPRESVVKLLPRGFRLVTHKEFAFWNIIVCRIDNLRPAGVPGVGTSVCHHVAYRLMASVKSTEGMIHKGLFYMRSDADNSMLCGAGNLMTEFRFHRSKINLTYNEPLFEASVEETKDGIADGYVVGERTDEDSLPVDSCFADPAEARKILKYTPNGLSLDKGGREVDMVDVERKESEWKESPFRVGRAAWAYFREIGQTHAELEFATFVEPVNCKWKLGKSVRLA